MCIRLPIGANGERVLSEAMSTLTAKSCAADLIWFGTGVRHILRELVQTSQGCSLVALCAALTEGHSTTVSALVLYDIAKEIGGPQELQPSLEQWEALVRTAAPAFNATTFGLRVHQIAKFAPSPQIQTGQVPYYNKNNNNSNSRTINTTPDTSHPTDLAKVLLSIGQVVQGNLRTVSVQGGCCCSWIAAWSDFVLGLRVLVRDANGIVVFANFNASEASAQVNVTFISGTPRDVLCVQTSHSVRSGVDFVRHCFGRQRFVQDHDLVFHSGTLTWSTMFRASFGTSFTTLVEHADDGLGKGPGTSISELINSERSVWRSVFLPRQQVFSRAMVAAIIILFANSTTISHYVTVHIYSLHACDIISELQPCKDDIQVAIREFLAILGAEDSLLDRHDTAIPSAIGTLTIEYRKYQEMLGMNCGCLEHRFKVDTIPIQFCLMKLTDTMIYMTYLLDRVVFDDLLQPTIYGMHRIYAASVRGSELPDDELNRANYVSFIRRLTRIIDERGNSCFSDLAALFSGQDWGTDMFGGLAQSDGKLYCYSQLIEGLTDNIRTATQIHVGSGQMEYRSRIYRVLYDRSGQAEHEPGYPAQHTELVDSIDCLGCDTTSSPITSEVVIVETPNHLYLRHQVNTISGQVLVNPVIFLEQLRAALAYRCSERVPASDSMRWNAVLQGHQYILTKGEGLVDIADKCHMLRPLQGNILGRCVAISKSQSPVALVQSRQELDIFARYWCRDYDERTLMRAKLQYYVLIS
jgi:hypothetical protein